MSSLARPRGIRLSLLHGKQEDGRFTRDSLLSQASVLAARFMPGIFVESCNPAFRITLERFEESHDLWPNDEILIFAEFSDRTRREIARFPVPNLEVGEQHSVVIDGVFVPRSGATKLAVSPTGRLRAANFSTFYAYSPLPEETLWYVGLTTLLLLGTLSASVYAALD